MQGMREFPDKYFDLAIVDPPYQINIGVGKSKTNGFKGEAFWEKMSKGWDKQRPNGEYFTELKRVSKNQIIWGANYFTEHLLPSMGWIFWYKGQPNFSFSDGEFAYTSFSCKARCFNYARGKQTPGGDEHVHPTQKPLSLYRWLLHHYAEPGQRILDTHVGSASSLIACEQMGFKYVGFEIDEEYYQQAQQRIDAARQRLRQTELVLRS